jgi:hypothetical protein
MAGVTFEEVLEMAEQLTAEERARLVKELQAKIPRKFTGRVTREMLLAEHERLKAAGAFENVESLYGKYFNPNVDISAEELDAYLHEIGTEWEKEMDELIGDD